MGEVGGALVEAIDRDGSVRQAWRVEHWPISIGRALDNDVVLGDPHVAPHHATLQLVGAPLAPPSATPGATPDDTGPVAAVGPAAEIVVTAGDTKNGLSLGRGRSVQRLAGGQTTSLADSGRDLDLQVGRTLLRLRLPGHALAAEQRIAPVAARDPRWLPTALLIAVLLAGVLFNTYLDTDPDDMTRGVGNALLTALSGGAIWCGFWALLSKIFARQAHFGWHVRVFVVASLVSIVIAAVPPLLAFSFSWPVVTDFSFVAFYATIAAAVYCHLLAVEPARQRLLRGVAAAGLVAGVALTLWFNVQRTGRPGEELYMSHLFPPAFRLARPISVDRFVDGLAPMQAILDQQAREQPAGSDNDSSEGEDDDN